MEFLQLRYFVELAKREHLTQVAEMMYVSPSAISSSISRLEEELGVKLFDRVGRNIKLSQYGKEYFFYVQRALNELDAGKLKLQDMLGSSDNQVSLATTNPYVWNKPIHDFCHMYPDILFKHYFFDSVSSGTRLPDEPVDLIISAPEAFSDPAWDSEFLFHDKIALAVPPGHPFTERDSISLIEAKDEWFVSLTDSSFSRFCYNLCLQAGFEPKSRLSCDYMLRPKMVLNEGMVCLTTYNGKYTGVFADIPLVPLTDAGATRSQAIFWRRDRYLSKSAVQFKNYLLDIYRDYQPEQI